MVIVFVVLVIVINKVLVSSWLGLAWQSLREDEVAARVMTINSAKFKVLAFAIGGAYGSLGGALYASFTTFITPKDFNFFQSILILVMVVFGGIGTIRGPIIGAILLAALPEAFRFAQNYRFIIYGSLLVFITMFMPKGVVGQDNIILNYSKKYIQKWSSLIRLRKGDER
jgi:branched-chain amino acid transport system permease protein